MGFANSFQLGITGVIRMQSISRNSVSLSRSTACSCSIRNQISWLQMTVWIVGVCIMLVTYTDFSCCFSCCFSSVGKQVRSKESNFFVRHSSYLQSSERNTGLVFAPDDSPPPHAPCCASVSVLPSKEDTRDIFVSSLKIVHDFLLQI